MLLGTFFRAIWTNEIFSSFLKFIQVSALQGALGKKKSKKLPRASLDTFWNVFRDFETLKSFWFLWIFLESPGFTGHSVFLRKNQSKHSQAMFLGTFSDVFESFKVFLFFKVFSKPRPSRVHWRLFSEEKLPHNRFGKCLDNIRDSFGHFRNIEIFHFFQSFPYLTLQGALGTNFTETITSKQVQNMFDCFWERFLGILKNWKFFVFWSFSKFRFSRVHWAFFSEKITSKQFQNLFGHFQERFWTLLKFQIVFDFFSNFSKFRPSRVHWSIFLPKKNYLEECWKRVWTLLGKILVILKKKLSFSILLKFFQVSTLQGALGTFFREKTSKQVQNLFGHFWKRVWVSWILRSFCISLKFFDVSTLQGALAKKSRKNHIKTCLDNLGNVFGHFWKFEFFSISVVLFRVSRVHWAEFFSVEIIMQNMLKQCFWERSWRILKVSKFFHLFCIFCEFRPPRVHWAKIFAKKITSKHVENMFDCFWERFFGQFEQMKFFPVFWSFSKFRPSRVHWARKNRKNYLEQVWTLFETFFGILKLWNLFDFCGFFLSLQGSLGTAFSVE